MPAGEPLVGQPGQDAGRRWGKGRSTPLPKQQGIDLAVRADCPRLMAGNDYQSHRTPRPGPAHRLADPEGLDPGPDGIAGNQHGGDGRDISALHALGRADPLPGAPGQPVPGFAQRRGRAGRTAAQPPTLAAHPPAKPGNTCAKQRSAPPPSNRRPVLNGCGCTCRPARAPWPSWQALDQQEVAVGVLLLAEEGVDHRAGGIVHGDQQRERRRLFPPPRVMAAVHLDQHALPGHALAAHPALGRPPAPRTAQSGVDRNTPQGGPANVAALPFAQQLAEMGVVDPAYLVRAR